jgi:biotin carboxylase
MDPLSTQDGRPLLLLVRTGQRELREYLLRPIAEHFRVHALTVQEPTWELPYLAGHDRLPETLDREALLGAVRRVNAAEPLDGMMCWQETHMPQVAYVADALGLPGAGQDAARRCRDKRLTREALAAAGVPQPRSVRVESEEQALRAAEQIGYPVVVKPSDLVAGFGVVRVDGPDEMREHYAATSSIPVPSVPGYRVTVLVEEYADGEEISVDSAVHAGTVYPLCLARKTTGFDPYFIETGHLVDANDPLRGDPALRTLLQQAHDAIGFGFGITHTEIRLTAAGPKIIEVNGRLGGDLVPYLGLRATGVDVGLNAARVACGMEPETRPDRRLAAGVRLFDATEHNSLISSIAFEGDGLPEAVDQLVVLARVGDRRPAPVKDPVNSRIAYATAVAPTAAECLGALDAAAGALRVVTGSGDDRPEMPPASVAARIPAQAGGTAEKAGTPTR